MKKLLSYLLVIALVLVQFVPVVNAAKVSGTNAPENNKGIIEIKNTIDGETYEIYKMFDLESYSYEDENGNKEGSYTYTISTESPWYAFLSGNSNIKLKPYKEKIEIVEWVGDENDIEEFARAALDYVEEYNKNENNTTKITPVKSEESEGNNIVFNELELGYYLVDSSLGALVILNTTNPKAEIQEKNTPPTIDKVIVEGSRELDTSNGDIGDVVSYKVEIGAKKGAQNYVLTDKMTDGLTFKNDVIVTDGTKTLTLGTDYEVILPEEDETFTFKVEFKKSYLKTIAENTTITVTYSAVINENAVIESTGNVNEAQLTYGDGTSTNWDETRTYVLGFNLVKNDSSFAELEGAEFELYTSITGGSALKFTYDEENNVYRYNPNGDKTKIKVGSARIEGLDEGEYYLEETKAPEGYNQLVNRIPVTLIDTTIDNSTEHKTTLEQTTSSTVQYEEIEEKATVTVINTTGTLLPSTGGMGTVLFVTVGSIMVLGFGVLLVTKLRLSKMSI